MNKSTIVILLGGLLFSACNKEGDASAGPDPAAARPASGGGSSAEVRAAEETAQKAIAAKDYDSAVGEMIKISQQKSLSQDEADKLRQLAGKLLEASQSDPRAKEAYRNMATMQKGR